MTHQEIRNHGGQRLDHTFHHGQRADTLVILGHGLTGNKDRPHLVAIAEGLAARGWPCLRISFSGNGESEGNFEDSNITREIGDLQAVLETVPHDVKIAYLGHSMGGGVGVLTAARDLRIRALISLSGMTHTAAFVEREFAEIIPGAGVMWENGDCPLSATFVEDLQQIGSTLSAAESIIQPWLLIHGDADDVVPVEDSRDAFAAATCQKQLLEIAHADHLFGESYYPQIIETIDGWLEKFLK